MRISTGFDRFNNLKTKYKIAIFIILAGIPPILIQMIVGSFTSRILVNTAKGFLNSQAESVLENQFRDYMLVTGAIFIVNVVLISIITIIFIKSWLYTK